MLSSLLLSVTTRTLSSPKLLRVSVSLVSCAWCVVSVSAESRSLTLYHAHASSLSHVTSSTQLVPGLATRAMNDTPCPIFVDPAGSVASGTSGSMHRQ